jgi:hypothetical protein
MAENELALAIEHFEAGRYPESELRAASAAIFGYAGSLEVVWPIVQEGLANPRESLLPVPILNRVYNAKRMFEEGEEAKGRIYLLNALREWCEISEAHMVVLVTLLPILVQTGQRGGGKSG